MRRSVRRRAITLLEIVLATAILVPMLGTVFWFYSSSLDTREQSLKRIRDVQLSRVILDRIVRELRQSTGFVGGYGTGIYGTRHKISLNTVMIPDKALVERRGIRKRQRPGQFDLRQIDYYIAWDDVNTDEEGDPRALGLVRRERRTFNQLEPAEADAQSTEGAEGEDAPGIPEAPEQPAGPGERGQPAQLLGDALSDVFDDSLDKELKDEELEGAKRELYAPEIKFIEFLYHDGHRWWDSWEIKEGNALPQMVMVTIGFKPELPEEEEIRIQRELLQSEEDIKPIPPDRYMTIVRIPQGDSFFGSRVQREASALSELGDLE